MIDTWKQKRILREKRVILNYFQNMENSVPSFHIYGGIRSLIYDGVYHKCKRRETPFHYTPRLIKKFS